MSSRESLEAAEREWERRAGAQLMRADQWRADALRYRKALEEIASWSCERQEAGRPKCPKVNDQYMQCPSCVARAALEEK